MRGKLCLLVQLFLSIVLLAGPAHAAPRDGAAEKKIQEAMYTHFLNMDFDTAEGLLVGTYRACEDKCSAKVKGRLWMYVGIVRGSGRQDISGAEEAFRQAIQEDPGVELDREIASPDVKESFDNIKGEGPPAGGGGGEGGGGGGSVGGMICSLDVSEVQVRRKIPIECDSQEELESAKIFFSNFNVKWTSVTMKQEAGLWRGTIPCTVTNSTGTVRWFVVGYDEDDEEVDSNGDRDSPREVEIVSNTSEDPPSFPEEEPPSKCDVSDIPVGGGGGGGGACAGWGGSCGGGGCCETGLVCLDGICEQEQCERNSDCPGDAECIDGKCAGEDDGGGGGDGAKNYIGLTFAIDIASISTDGACTDEARANESFTCAYGDGTAYEGTPNQNFGGEIKGGFTPSTMRVLASYDRMIGQLSLGVRAGFAFRGGPSLLPVHAGARVGYWFVGDFAKPGPRVGVHLGGGLAQVDATVDVDIKDCPLGPNDTITPENEACVNAVDAGTVTTLQATKQLGLTYIEAGLGFVYAIGKNHGPMVIVNGMFMVPSTGMVLQPNFGYTVGF